MPHAFDEIAFTPDVKAAQQRALDQRDACIAELESRLETLARQAKA